MTDREAEIRAAILENLLSIHKSAKGVKKVSVGIMDVRKAMKDLGYKREEVVSNLDILIQKGWVLEVKEDRTYKTTRGTMHSAPKITYKISAKGIENKTGKAKMLADTSADLDGAEESNGKNANIDARDYSVLFNNRGFHKSVVISAESLFCTGHFRQAILDAFIKLEESIRDKSGANMSGAQLVDHVFSTARPILVVSNRDDERKGALLLFKGAFMYIRNVKAHSTTVKPKGPNEALEWLSLASALFRLVDESSPVP